MIRLIKQLYRIFTILRILGKYDVLFPEQVQEKSYFVGLVFRVFNRKYQEKNLGIRLAKAFTELGPAFIKLGQILSTRADLLGEDAVEGLSQLRDRLPAFHERFVIETLEDQFGKPFDQIFKTFDLKPKAAASIAQVHQATTHEGDRVAVKIRRPDIKKAFDRDLNLLDLLVGFLMKQFIRFKRLRLDEVFEKFRTTCELEMDFRMEAAAASELKDQLKGLDHYDVPKIYWDYSGEKILTLQWVEGHSIDEVDKLKKEGINLDIIIESSAISFFRQIFEYGFFHADPHPGNYIVDKTGVVWVLDFGIMGRLDYQERLYLSEMLVGFLTKDYYRVSVAHFEAGYVPKSQDVMLFMQAIRSIGEPILDKSLKEISLGKLLQQLFSVSEQFQMIVQPQLLLLQKSMLTAEGLCMALNPEANIWEITKPLVEGWIRDHQGPEAQLARGVKKSIKAMKQLPDLVDKLSQQQGELETFSTTTSRKIGFQSFLIGILVTSAIWGIAITML